MNVIGMSGSEWSDVTDCRISRIQVNSGCQLKPFKRLHWLPLAWKGNVNRVAIHGKALRERVASGYTTHASVCKPFVSLVQRSNSVFHTNLLFIFGH